MLVVGELINCTRAKIREAVERQDVAYIQDLARRQVEAGANYLDVNSGIPRKDVSTMEWLVSLVQEAVDLPLSIDSSDPDAIAKGLELCRRNGKVLDKPLVNSVNAEKDRLERLLPILSEYRPKAIVMCMDSEGIPDTSEGKITIAARLIEQVARVGLPLDDIYVDPCVFPVSADKKHGGAALDAVEKIMTSFPGVHTICGLSNISFGLPKRKQLNQGFLLLMMARGLDAIIADPLETRLMLNIITAETLLGRDDYCRNYIAAFRQGKMEGLV
ncbi:MAG: dihydropteroate synthase [Nitrospinota bacterium]|nr:dihydropteroate synthase [Nitrospinota bacterium]